MGRVWNLRHIEWMKQSAPNNRIQEGVMDRYNIPVSRAAGCELGERRKVRSPAGARDLSALVFFEHGDITLSAPRRAQAMYRQRSGQTGRFGRRKNRKPHCSKTCPGTHLEAPSEQIS